MRGPIQYQRQFILQVHCGINAFCFIVTLICILALRFSIGLIELFALILPIIGVLSLFMNSNLGKGRKVMKECYLFGSLASYLLWIIDLIMTVFICLDLRIILFKGR